MIIDPNISTFNSNYYLDIFNSAENSSQTLLSYTIELARINVGMRPNNKIEGGPFGALVFDPTQQTIVGLGTNHVVPNSDPSAHAEVIALRDARSRLQSNDMSHMHLYTSCECCPMCLSLAISLGIKTINFAATRFDAAKAFFSDEVQYRLINLPLSSQISRATSTDIAMLAEAQAIIIDASHNIIAKSNLKPKETPVLDALQQACSKLQLFHLPEDFKIISRKKPHPYSLIAADWARIGRVRNSINPEDPSKDKFEKDTSKITYIEDEFESLGLTTADEVFTKLLSPTDIKITHIENPNSFAPFKAWLAALDKINNAVKY